MNFSHPIRVIFFLALLCPWGHLQAQDPTEAPPQEEPPQQEQQEPIRVDVNLFTLRFTVRNALGELVNDLSSTDFRILENGIPREISFFERPRNRAARSPKVGLAFLLDVSGSTFATRAEEIVAAETFLKNIGDATQVGIYGFTDVLIPFQPFTANRDLALRAFREARRHLGKTAIYTTLESLMTQMARLGGPELSRTVIVISDGLDDDYGKWAATAAEARRQGIRIYTILVPSAAQVYIGPAATSRSLAVNNPDPAKEAKEKAFSQLSLSTGGKHFSGFEAILDFDDTLAQISDDMFGNLYSISYYTEDILIPAHARNIDIIPSRSGLSVSDAFRRLPQQLVAKKSLIAALFEASGDNLDLGFENSYREIGAEIDILPIRRESGQLGLPFRIKINPFSFLGSDRGGVSTQIGVIGVLLDGDGREAVRLREIFRVDLGAKEIREGHGIVYTNKLFAPPGAYELKLALLELATWRLTSFERRVRISEP